MTLKSDNVILMPNGEVAILHTQPQQKIEIEKETFKKIDVAFLKIVHMLPDGCLLPECIIKLSERYPMLPFSCSNCSNSEKLILKTGFYPHALPLCKECSNSNCANTPPLQRMRKILFRKCELLER